MAWRASPGSPSPEVTVWRPEDDRDQRCFKSARFLLFRSVVPHSVHEGRRLALAGSDDPASANLPSFDHQRDQYSLRHMLIHQLEFWTVWYRMRAGQFCSHSIRSTLRRIGSRTGHWWAASAESPPPITMTVFWKAAPDAKKR